MIDTNIQISQEHQYRHFTDSRDVYRSLQGRVKLREDRLDGRTHLVSHILLKIFVSSNIEAYATILQPLRFDLVRRTRNCRNNHIRYSKALLQGQIAGVGDMSWMIFLHFCRFRRLIG